MTDIKFIHIADVHLDSPLDRIRRLDESTAARLQQASRTSLENVVQTALDRQVDAVIIAGDLFDGPVKDASAGLWVDSQFKRLSRAGIPVVLIRGNHDAHNGSVRLIQWSGKTSELGVDRAETIVLDQAGLAIHGQSFGARAQQSDMTVGYPNPIKGLFNIGMLHTSLAGSSAHDVYAPTSVNVLESKGYDYWALGHIHQRSLKSLGTQAYIGYSGNTQGRHIREPGPKGLNLVQLQDGKLASVQFVPTDSLRWAELELDVGPLELMAQIEDLLEEQVHPLLAKMEDRYLALRIRLTGATALHGPLNSLGAIDKLADLLSQRLSEFGPVWLERIKLATSHLDTMHGFDVDLPLHYLDQVADGWQKDEVAHRQLEKILDELLKNCRQELDPIQWPLASQQSLRHEELQRMVAAARDLVLSRLSAGSHETMDS
jgi:DNA repair exonuclease SbcCD nuclease subunit